MKIVTEGAPRCAVLARRPGPIDHATEERAMPHLFDPSRIATHATYLAALDELDALMDEDPDAAANRRIDELFALIEEYELRRRVSRAA